jgi:NADP-dependent 3-hydroxy acid dehydrogenase YdfG
MNKTILCTGNPEYGVASAIAERWPQTQFVSRTNWNYDLTENGYKHKLAEKALSYDVFINCSALWHYHQTMLLDVVYKMAESKRKQLHIVSLGSTTDRATKGSDWQYQQEKKALRSTSNALNLKSIWQGGPRVSYISFGTLENNAHKHPGRQTMLLSEAVDLIEYVLTAPEHLCINEISADPLQLPDWYQNNG